MNLYICLYLVYQWSGFGWINELKLTLYIQRLPRLHYDRTSLSCMVTESSWGTILIPRLASTDLSGEKFIRNNKIMLLSISWSETIKLNVFIKQYSAFKSGWVVTQLQESESCKQHFWLCNYVSVLGMTRMEEMLVEIVVT